LSATTQHIYLDKQHPALWRALNGLGLKVREAAGAAGLDETTVELLRVRVSQLNGCAYCLDLHVREAMEAGETVQRLAVLPAWRETALFTETRTGREYYGTAGAQPSGGRGGLRPGAPLGGGVLCGELAGHCDECV
jgi:AhpD family alkylhydroperoxidase